MRIKNVIPATIHEWGRFREKEENKILKQEYIDNYFISTVFVGVQLNICFEKEEKPHVFETMVFKDDSGIDIYCDTYPTYKEAIAGHEKALQWVKDGCKEE